MKIKLTEAVKHPKSRLSYHKLAWLLWDDLANEGYNKIDSKYYQYVNIMPTSCPLCSLYRYLQDICDGCCLRYCFNGGLYTKWWRAKTKPTRKKYARKIADTILKEIMK